MKRHFHLRINSHNNQIEIRIREISRADSYSYREMANHICKPKPRSVENLRVQVMTVTAPIGKKHFIAIWKLEPPLDSVVYFNLLRLESLLILLAFCNHLSGYKSVTSELLETFTTIIFQKEKLSNMMFSDVFMEKFRNSPIHLFSGHVVNKVICLSPFASNW